MVKRSPDDRTQPSWKREETQLPQGQRLSADTASGSADTDGTVSDAALDRTLVRVDLSVFVELAALIDTPASRASAERVMSAPVPWNERDPSEHGE